MTKIAAQPRTTLSTRMGTSPKTLHRKAMEKAAAAPKVRDAGGLEELFPEQVDAPADHAPASAEKLGLDAAPAHPVSEPASADQSAAPLADDVIELTGAPAQADLPPSSPPSTAVEDQPAQAAPTMAVTQPSWSDADERAYQAMLARRKAAGFQRRGRDVSTQRVKVGAVAPNKGTVVADIVGLVAERGAIGRGELLDLMATAAFAHPKGKGSDRAWSQGYVSGAIASGCLALVDGGALGEASPEATANAAWGEDLPDRRHRRLLPGLDRQAGSVGARAGRAACCRRGLCPRGRASHSRRVCGGRVGHEGGQQAPFGGGSGRVSPSSCHALHCQAR